VLTFTLKHIYIPLLFASAFVTLKPITKEIMRDKLYIIFIITIMLTPKIFSQDSKHFDAPFGGGGGYTPGWVFPNLDPVNKELSSSGIPALSKSGFYTSGGAGFIYIGFIKNLRIGGLGYSGSTTEISEIDNNGFTREVRYGLGGGGLTIEYSLPLIRDFAVSLGVLIGAGSINIDIYYNDGNFDWNDIWTEGQSSGMNFSHSLRNGYFMFAPTLNVDIPLYRFISLRIGGGYQVTFSGDWIADNDRKLTNVPSNLNGNTFFLQTGIFIGFFSY
jgi:hypothetical protein